MSFSREQVVKVAKLARLTLVEAEIEAMSHHLGAILDYFEQLQSIDTTNVEPLAHPAALQNVFREDEPAGSLSVDAALANAPKRTGDFFAVPAILD